jgi:hypothetical protein
MKRYLAVDSTGWISPTTIANREWVIEGATALLKENAWNDAKWMDVVEFDTVINKLRVIKRIHRDDIV